MIIRTNENDIPPENLLGCANKSDLYNRLLEKSIFAFPEYEKRSRQGISNHVTNLIVAWYTSKSEFMNFSYNSNRRLYYHLKKLAEKGFASYATGKRKGQIKLNLEKIKTDWLELDYKKTDEEFENEAIKRIDKSINNILNDTHALVGKPNVLAILSDVASNLEILEANVKKCRDDRGKITKKNSKIIDGEPGEPNEKMRN